MAPRWSWHVLATQESQEGDLSLQREDVLLSLRNLHDSSCVVAKCICIYIYRDTCMCCTNTHTDTYTHVYIYIYTCICNHIYIYTCINQRNIHLCVCRSIHNDIRIHLHSHWLSFLIMIFFKSVSMFVSALGDDAVGPVGQTTDTWFLNKACRLSGAQGTTMANLILWFVKVIQPTKMRGISVISDGF